MRWRSVKSKVGLKFERARSQANAAHSSKGRVKQMDEGMEYRKRVETENPLII